MHRRIFDFLGLLGVVVLFGGYLYYTLYTQWNWITRSLIFGGVGLLVLYVLSNFSSIISFFNTRTGRHGMTAGVSLLLFLGILVLVNFLNQRHHYRKDLTENAQFALSEQSRKVVSGLKNDIHLKAFYVKKEESQPFVDLMEEYRYVSSRIKYEVIDPQQDPGLAQQYQIQRDGQIVVLNGPRKEVVDSATEEKITNAIIKITRKGEKVVYFMTGHGERDINGTSGKGYSAARDAVKSKNYVVKSINLAQEGTLPADAAVIISDGPTVDFFPNETPLLERYLASGGKFLLMVDPQNKFAMNAFLAQYGLKLDHDVVVDASGLGQLIGLGPAAPIADQYADHPMTKDLKSIMTFFPLAQSVQTITSSLGYKTTALVSTRPQSWGETELKGQSASYDAGKDFKGPLHLAAVAVHEGAETTDKKASGDSEASKSKGPEARLVLFGDSDFASNQYFDKAANGDLFQAAVNWLAEESDLVAVPPKNPENRRISLTFGESRLLFWGTVLILPLLVLILGISVWYRRR